MNARMRGSGLFKTLRGQSLLRIVVAASLALMPASPWVWVRSAQAQTTPSLISFQGRLTDTINNPLGGTHTFDFAIYNVPTLGAPLWSETQPGLATLNGLVSVQLGAVTPIPATVFYTDQAYLQITVDGTPLTPRERLITVPYAYSARLLEGRPYLSFVSTEAVTQAIAGDKSFTGTLVVPAPTLAGHAATKGYVDAQVGGAASGWTDDGTVIRLTASGDSVVIQSTLTIQGNAFSVGGSTLVVAEGNLGIGTTAPGRRLEVYDSSEPILRLSGNKSADGTFADIEFLNRAGNTAAAIKANREGSDDSLALAFTIRSNGNPVDALMINGLGNVGIGTTSPFTNKLQVVGGAVVFGNTSGGTNSTFWLQNGTANGNFSQQFLAETQSQTPGNYAQIIRFSNSTTGSGFYNAGSLVIHSSLKPLVLTTNEGTTTPELYIGASGDVGIGTSGPATKLDVEGDAQFGVTAKSTFTTTGRLRFPTSYTPALGEEAATKGYVDAQIGGAASGWTDDGTVVRLTSPGDSVVVQSTLTIQGSAFSVGGSTLVAASGNVGIGTTGPKTDLQIGAGSVIADESFGTYGAFNAYWTGAAWNYIADGAAGGYALVSNGEIILRSAVSGLAGAPLTWLDRLTIQADGDVLTGSGNVGVGTVAPTHKLDVNGGAIFRSSVTWTGLAADPVNPVAGQGAVYFNTGSSKFRAFDNGSWVDMVGAAAVGGWSDDGAVVRLADAGDNVVIQSTLTVQGNAFSVGGSTLAVIGGNVGIGTTGPVYPLDIRAAQGVLGLASTTGANSVYTTFNNTGGNAYIGLERSIGGNLITGSAAHALALAAPSSRLMQFGTNDAVRMTIDTSGNVGIGTTGPGRRLEVESTVSGEYPVRVDGVQPILELQASGGTVGYIGAGASFFQAGGIANGLLLRSENIGIQFAPGGSGSGVAVTMLPSGSVGIGTTGPQSKLQVLGTTGNPSGTAGTAAMASFQSGSGTDLIFGSMVGSPFTGWIQHRHATVNDSYFPLALNPLGGNVGIGTTNPGFKLDVNGSFGGTFDSSNNGQLKIGYTASAPAGYYATYAP